MNIVICGAGEVGRHTAEVLGGKNNNITIVDLDPAKLAMLDEVMDARSLQGNGTQADVQLEAGVAKADLFIAATQNDEANLLAASVAKAVGADLVIARVHHSSYFEKRGLDYARHLGIDHLVCPEHSTARAITAALRSPGAIAFERLAGDQIEMHQVRIASASDVSGRALSELRLDAPARVAAIEADEVTAIPDAATVLRAGDIVTLIGEAATFAKVAKRFDPKADRKKKVVVMGSTSQAVWLCRALKGRGFSTRVIVGDAARAAELSEKLDWVTVLHADSINSDVLVSERVDQADAFVAVTDDDESNVLAAALAKTRGVPSAIAVQQRGTYLHLLEHIGIDRAFSPRQSAVSEVQWFLARGSFRHLATVAPDTVEVYEAKVTAAAKDLAGVPLKMVKLPPGTIIGAVSREGGEVFVPTGETALQPADTAIVFGPATRSRELKRLFTGR